MLPDLSALVVTGSPACGANEEKKSELTVLHYSNTNPKTRRALWACRTDNQTCRDTYSRRASRHNKPYKFVEVTLSTCPKLLHLRNDHVLIGKLFDQYKAAILVNGQYIDMIKGIFLSDNVLQKFKDGWLGISISEFLIIQEYKSISQDEYVASTFSEYVARDTNPYLEIMLLSSDKIDIRSVSPPQNEPRPAFQVDSTVWITTTQDGVALPHGVNARVQQHPGASFKFDPTTGRVLFKHGTNGGDVYGAFNVRLRAKSQLHVSAAETRPGVSELVKKKSAEKGIDIDLSKCILREDDDGGQDLAIIHFMSWVADTTEYQGISGVACHIHCVFTSRLLRATGYEHEGAIDLRSRQPSSSKDPSFLIGEIFLAEKQAEEIAIAWDMKYSPYKATQRVPPEIPHHYEWNEWIQLDIGARLHHDECPSMFLDLTGKDNANPFIIVYRLVKEALLKKKPK